MSVEDSGSSSASVQQRKRDGEKEGANSRVSECAASDEEKGERERRQRTAATTTTTIFLSSSSLLRQQQMQKKADASHRAAAVFHSCFPSASPWGGRHVGRRSGQSTPALARSPPRPLPPPVSVVPMAALVARWLRRLPAGLSGRKFIGEDVLGNQYYEVRALSSLSLVLLFLSLVLLFLSLVLFLCLSVALLRRSHAHVQCTLTRIILPAMKRPTSLSNAPLSLPISSLTTTCGSFTSCSARTRPAFDVQVKHSGRTSRMVFSKDNEEDYDPGAIPTEWSGEPRAFNDTSFYHTFLSRTHLHTDTHTHICAHATIHSLPLQFSPSASVWPPTCLTPSPPPPPPLPLCRLAWLARTREAPPTQDEIAQREAVTQRTLQRAQLLAERDVRRPRLTLHRDRHAQYSHSPKMVATFLEGSGGATA